LYTSSSNAPSGSLLLAISGTSIDMTETASIDSVMQKFSEWIKNSPNPAAEIFDVLMSDIDVETRGVLEHLILTGEYEGLTESILNEMALASETEYAGWEMIMGLTSINSTDERDTMLSVLPSLTDESLVSAALHAVRPQLLPAEERMQFVNDLSPYANSENEGIKSAAIITLGHFSAHDYSYVIEDALVSGTEEIKRSAIYAASFGGMRTDTIKNQISAIMLDESASIELRAEAFDGLNSFNLNEKEYNLYYEFYRNHILPLEREANRG